MQNWPNISLIVLLCIAGWVILMNLISVLTGWRRFAEFYRAERPFSGKKFFAQRARLRAGMGYNGVLTIGADPQGLYVSVFVVFGFGHSPLFIPWEDVSATAKRVWRINMVILQFSKCPSIPFWISKRLADKLAMASGHQLVDDRKM